MEILCGCHLVPAQTCSAWSVHTHYSGMFAGFSTAPEFSRFAGLSLHRNVLKQASLNSKVN